MVASHDPGGQGDRGAVPGPPGAMSAVAAPAVPSATGAPWAFTSATAPVAPPQVWLQPNDRVPMGRRAMIPFATAALLALAVAPWFATSAPAALWGAAGLTAATIGLTFLLSRRERFGWLDVVPSLLYVASVALLRHGSGGAESAYGSLLLLPVVAMALYGSRLHLALVLVAATATIGIPILVVGGPLYPDSEWRRLLVLTAVASLIGLAVNELVGRVARLHAAAETAGRDAAEQAHRVAQILDASSDPILTLDPELRITSWNPAASELLGYPAAAAIGRYAPELLLGPDDTARVRQGFAAIRRGRVPARMRFEIDVRTAAGGTVPFEVGVLVDPEAPTLAAHLVAREIGERRAADALARVHVEELSELVRIAGALGKLDDPAAVRTLMCEAAILLARADHAFLFEPGADGTQLVPTAQAGSLRVPHVVLRRDASRAGHVMAEGRPYFDPDIAADPAADRAAASRMGVRSAYWQPIRREGESIGVLVLYWATARDELQERTTQLLALLADQARTAIARAEHLGRVAEEATTDPLTGAANRRGLRDALELARASGRPFSVVLLDHDRFKAYNDTHGHLAGDELLRAGVAAWSALLRPQDVLTRYGGEEFLVVLPGCGLEEAAAAADRLRAALPGGRTVSAGVATWDGREAIADLTARVDAALYRAKRRGRDRTEVDPPPPGSA